MTQDILCGLRGGHYPSSLPHSSCFYTLPMLSLPLPVSSASLFGLHRLCTSTNIRVEAFSEENNNNNGEKGSTKNIGHPPPSVTGPLAFPCVRTRRSSSNKKPNENKGSKLLSDKMVEGRRSLFGAQISTPERCIPILVLSP